MRTKRQVAAGLLGALLLLPVPASAIAARGLTRSNQSVTARQTSLPGSIGLSRRDLNRHQFAERRQLSIYVRRLSALLRAHQLAERRLLAASTFQVPPPVAPIPTPFPF